MSCPHRDAIQFCPLYVAAHAPKCFLLTCMGDIDPVTNACAVDQGKLDYSHAVESVRATDPMLVAQCQFGKMKHDALLQISRNMRAIGFH